MAEDYSNENKCGYLVAGALGIFGSILENANRAELNRQMIINERYKEELRHIVLDDYIEYKTHQFDR